MPKKKEKRLISPIKQRSKDDLDNSNKSENLFICSESDISIKEDKQSHVSTLDDITEDKLTKLCGKKIFSIILQEFYTRMKINHMYSF